MSFNLFYDEKRFDQNGQYSFQNECIYAESRETANKDFGTRPEHKFRQFKEWGFRLSGSVFDYPIHRI